MESLRVRLRTGGERGCASSLSAAAGEQPSLTCQAGGGSGTCVPATRRSSSAERLELKSRGERLVACEGRSRGPLYTHAPYRGRQAGALSGNCQGRVRNTERALVLNASRVAR